MFRMELDLSPKAFPEAPVRARDLRFVVSCLRQGQCCSVVAPSNMGKSHLLKSLLREEVRQACAREETKPKITVFVDCLEAGDSEHAFYELLLRRIVEELDGSGIPASTADTLRALHREVLGPATDLTVRSLFASSLREVNRTGDVGLVVILDEFDDVFRTLPPWPFRQLRALRDALEDRLCYVTGTSRRLERLRSDAHTYEFRELFHLYTWVMRPMPEQDSRRFVLHLATEQGRSVDDVRTSLLIELSGGHPGLLERVYSMLSEVHPDQSTPLEVAATEFSRKPPIEQECQRLWDELQEEEQEGLLGLAAGEPALDPLHRRALEAKGLAVAGEERDLAIFSPIFEVFVQGELARRRTAMTGGVRCELETGQIWVDDQEVTLKLSDAQRKLVRFLYQRAGAVCTYDEIAQNVWGVGQGVSPGAIYELVKRLRQKVELDWRSPCYIVTVPGEGYRLQVPE